MSANIFSEFTEEELEACPKCGFNSASICWIESQEIGKCNIPSIYCYNCDYEIEMPFIRDKIHKEATALLMDAWNTTIRNMKMKTIMIEGTISGDGECFCLEVSEEVYRNYMGEEKYQSELAYQKELSADLRECGVEEPAEPYKALWRIYPGNLFGYDKKKIKLTITIESTQE